MYHTSSIAIIHGLSHLILWMFLPHRCRVCHLTPEHSCHLWLHQRTAGVHPARVRPSITNKTIYLCLTVWKRGHTLFPLLLHSLKDNYTDDSLTWDFMAKKELVGLGAGEELQSAKGRASDINRREERCCQVYEEGVKSLSTGSSLQHGTDAHRRFIQGQNIWNYIISEVITFLKQFNPPSLVTWELLSLSRKRSW